MEAVRDRKWEHDCGTLNLATSHLFTSLQVTLHHVATCRITSRLRCGSETSIEVEGINDNVRWTYRDMHTISWNTPYDSKD